MKRWLLLALVFFICTSCNRNKSDLAKAKTLSYKKEFQESLDLFDKLMLKNDPGYYSISAAREAARILFYELKDHEKAIKYYRHLILYSSDKKERLFSQKQIADIYFNMLKYKEAAIEINKLVPILEELKERQEYRLKLAKAYFYMSDFFQSMTEINELLKTNPSSEIQFKALVMQSHLLMSEKKYDNAIDILKKIITLYPDESVEEKVAVALSIGYEEKKDFNKAIEVMEKFSKYINNKDYVELRIKRLKERQRNAPGARGLNRK